MGRKAAYCLLLLLFLLFIQPASISGEGEGLTTVYVVPVEQTIERGLEKFLERSFRDAAQHKADAILLEIDTLGGEIGAADRIGRLIRESQVPVTAYIRNKAISAGAYIALNADRIVMAPGSQMGASAPVDLSGNMASKKVFSLWVNAMESAARLNGRDPSIARGMVDPDFEIPGMKKKGELLTLDAETALKAGYCEKVLPNRQEVLKEFFGGPDNVQVIEMKLSAAERLARFVTNPYVMAVLLIIGITGLATELLLPGFGFPGVLGVAAFALYFFGHLFAGFAEWEHILLFAVGILLVVVEIFVPGFGIFGVLGIASLVTGLLLASYDLTQGLSALGIAVTFSLIALFFIIKIFGHRGIWNRFVLREQLTAEKGYVSQEDRHSLVGKEGIALTPLRPAGTVQIGEERIDVVSEGEFIPAGSRVVVLAAEGARVVVRKT